MCIWQSNSAWDTNQSNLAWNKQSRQVSFPHLVPVKLTPELAGKQPVSGRLTGSFGNTCSSLFSAAFIQRFLLESPSQVRLAPSGCSSKQVQVEELHLANYKRVDFT